MFLLDTHVLLWLASDQTKLTEKVKITINSNAGSLYVSSISAFEIVIKHLKNKLELPLSPEIWFHRATTLHGIDEITINSEILIKAALLPQIHNDPVDRIIIATAMLNNAKILSKDTLISQYPGVNVIWE
jgi:PIN domain nuclease of toxin-antitoxin system